MGKIHIKQERDRETTCSLLLEITEFQKVLCKIPKVWHGCAVWKPHGEKVSSSAQAITVLVSCQKMVGKKKVGSLWYLLGNKIFIRS